MSADFCQRTPRRTVVEREKESVEWLASERKDFARKKRKEKRKKGEKRGEKSARIRCEGSEKKEDGLKRARGRRR